jgi:hypothetical protein
VRLQALPVGKASTATVAMRDAMHTCSSCPTINGPDTCAVRTTSVVTTWPVLG